jgi:hypothetical protein
MICPILASAAGLRSAKNREQTQQQHLGERINDFVVQQVRAGTIKGVCRRGQGALGSHGGCAASHPAR